MWGQSRIGIACEVGKLVNSLDSRASNLQIFISVRVSPGCVTLTNNFLSSLPLVSATCLVRLTSMSHSIFLFSEILKSSSYQSLWITMPLSLSLWPDPSLKMSLMGWVLCSQVSNCNSILNPSNRLQCDLGETFYFFGSETLELGFFWPFIWNTLYCKFWNDFSSPLYALFCLFFFIITIKYK